MTFADALDVVDRMESDEQKRVLERFRQIAAAFTDVRIAFAACVQDEFVRQQSESPRIITGVVIAR